MWYPIEGGLNQREVFIRGQRVAFADHSTSLCWEMMISKSLGTKSSAHCNLDYLSFGALTQDLLSSVGLHAYHINMIGQRSILA